MTEDMISKDIVETMTRIVNILKSQKDDSVVFKAVLEQIMGVLTFCEKASFWLIKKDGEHFVTGIGYEPDEYQGLVIPLEHSLSMDDPYQDVKIIDTGFFSSIFPADVRELFKKHGVKENISKSLQIRLKAYGDYFGVLCFDDLDGAANFDNEVISNMQYLAKIINAILEMRITLITKKRENIYRDNLVANISHDVRTPLTVIMGYTELMQDLMKDNDEIMGFLQIMEEQSNFLLNIISDLITLSKINSGNFQLNPQSTNLREMLHNTLKGLRVLAKKKGLKLDYSVASSVPLYTYLDRISLKKILYNLVSNAIKYSDEGQITVEIKLLNENHLKLEVKDTGIGIAKDRLSIIFDKYTRESSSSNRQGSGLGLHICKSLVESLGGVIWAESELNKGSTFHVLIPLTQSGAQHSKDVHQKKESVLLTGKKFLIIEDDPENMHMYETVLKNAGALCCCFDDPAEALIRCKMKVRIDYVLLDLLLSKGSSIEFIKKIKDCLDGQKIIAITGSSDPVLQRKALDAGAGIVLLKPFSLNELLDYIK